MGARGGSAFRAAWAMMWDILRDLGGAWKAGRRGPGHVNGSWVPVPWPVMGAGGAEKCDPAASSRGR